MADKLFDRAFNKALAGHNVAESQAEAQRPRTKEEEEVREQAELRKAEAPMAVSDAIKRMLLAEKDKDYFRMLELPAPEVDELGRPRWPCTGADISRAYRRLSALVHPDKNPGADARSAFEALTKAHRLLKDPGKLEEALNSNLDAAKRREEAAEAAATPDERVVLYAAKRERAAQLKKEESALYQADILEQRRRMQERAKRKRELQSSYRREDETADDADVEEKEEDVERRKPAAKPRKGKPRLIF